MHTALSRSASHQEKALRPCVCLASSPITLRLQEVRCRTRSPRPWMSRRNQAQSLQGGWLAEIQFTGWRSRLTLVVVSQVVLLHLSHVLRQPGVVKGIVHAVVEDVESVCARDDSVGDRLGEYEVGELCKGVGEGEEKNRRHDETKAMNRNGAFVSGKAMNESGCRDGLPVHRKVMVDTVQQEVQHQRPVGVRQQVIDVEQESMETVFQKCPNDVACEETGDELGE